MAPIYVPYTLESVVIAIPSKEWKVARDANGIITANLLDKQSGLLLNSLQLNFERGDQVNIRYHLDKARPSLVTEGNTVITVESAELEQRLLQIESQLLVEKQNKIALETGQKSELIRQLQAQVVLEKEALDIQQKNFTRVKGLYENEAVALAELEFAQNDLNEAQVNVGIAEKAVEVAQTGEKAETIAVANARIQSLKTDLEFLRRKKADYLLKSPLTGYASYVSSLNGEAFVIYDTSAVSLQIPVRLRDQGYLRPGQAVKIAIRDTGQKIPAKIISIDSNPQLLGGELAVFVIAEPEEAANIPNWEVPMRCELNCGSVTIREFLHRAIRWQ